MKCQWKKQTCNPCWKTS